MYELRDTRERWFDAYYQGDVKKLERIEAEGFTCISERGVEAQNERYNAITKAVAAGKWYKNGSKEDLETDFLPNGDSCQVYGTAHIYSGTDIIATVRFSEYWIKQRSDWLIQGLNLWTL